MCLKTLEIKFTAPAKIKLNQSIGSIMQGILMERIDPSYAEYLHQKNIRPYSQYIFFDAKSQYLVWRISSLNQDSFEQILLPLEQLSDNVYMRHKQINLKIINKQYTYNKTYESLVQQYFNDERYLVDNMHIEYDFITSTAFKRQGKYIIFPEIPLLLNNLLLRWNTYSSLDFLAHKEIYKQMPKYLFTTDYKLKMRPFSLEGIRIPAFVGSYSIGVQQNLTAQKLISLLSEFAMISGIGIKTAIGMGAVKTQIR